jgi:molybdenum cofactor cytidylyltransferase
LPDRRHDRGDIAAIVLAAGASRRFGSDKLLHPLALHGVTLPLVAHSLRPWLESFAHVTVVVRPGSGNFCRAVEKALGANKSTQIGWIECEDAAQGMALSLACGVRANLGACGWLIGLADMPGVPMAAIAAVRKALLIGAVLAAPTRNDRRGHPVGFASEYRDELLALRGDAGARRIVERDIARLAEINIEDAGIFADIDIPGDLLQLCRMHGNNRSSTDPIHP